MIILKNKTFTRAEKEAIKELLIKTRNLTRVPSGTNLKRGHSQRLGNAAIDIGNWVNNGKRPNTENIKEYLNQLGLKKGSAAIDKVIDKYSNKRAIARLERMKKNGAFKEVNSVSEEKKLKRLTNKFNTSMERGENLRKHYDSIPITKEDIKLSKKLREQLKSEQIPVVTLNPSPWSSKTDAYAALRWDKHQPSEAALEGLESHVMEVSGKELTPRIKSLVKKTKNPFIVLPKKPNPTLGYHEKGHIDFANTPAGKRVEYGNISNVLSRAVKPSINAEKHPMAEKINKKIHSISDSLSILSHENGASEHAIQNLIKNGASKEKLRQSRDMLKRAGSAYMDNSSIPILFN